jgi:hypothetical protein
VSKDEKSLVFRFDGQAFFFKSNQQRFIRVVRRSEKAMKKMILLALGLSVLLITSPASAAFFLRGTGPDNNPPVIFLDSAAPTASTAKYRDSASVKFAEGNQWKEIGTWEITTTGILTETNDLHVWLGLKNSDDIGTKFDLRAEIYKNGTTLITAGELYCITGITRNPDLAKEVALSFASSSTLHFYGDLLSLRILTRIGTDGAGTFCGGHSNAVGLRLYFDALSRPSMFNTTILENSPPVANAGHDQQVRVGDLVSLDGRSSYDPDDLQLGDDGSPTRKQRRSHQPDLCHACLCPGRTGKLCHCLNCERRGVRQQP